MNEPFGLDQSSPDETGGSQLRKALGTMNDLQPPVDELFAQRAVVRGRARAYRRRSSVLGVAAAVAIVGGGAGSWWALQQQSSTTSAGTTQADSPAGAESAGEDDGEVRYSAEPKITDLQGPAAPTPGGALAPTAREGSGWFVGPMTPGRAALESLEPQLTTTWAQVFSGAWSADESNQQLVVALTARNVELEQVVRGAAGPVQFVVAGHSYAEKSALADRIRADAAAGRLPGIEVESVGQDFRNDRVVVVARGEGAAGELTRRYGADWVSVTTVLETSVGKLPDGSTLPTLHR